MVIPSIVPQFLVDQPDRIWWMVGGYLLAQLWEAVKDRFQHRKLQRVGALGAVMMILFAMNIWIAAKTEQTSQHQKDMADQSAQCWVDYANNIATRSIITSDNDRLFIVQMQAINELFVDTARAPNGMSSEQQLTNLKLRVATTQGVIGQVLRRLNANQEERAKHPIAIPVCHLAR